MRSLPIVVATAASASWNVLRVVPDHLVQHLLRVFGGVQEGVQVGLGELGDTSKIL
jgi:hypothetical protein